jgi:Tol biopolymer transport system component
MKRSKPIIGLTAVALALPLGAMSASATEAPPVGATVWTEWISDDGGAARELPAISANGRYVVMAGRSDAADGIWIKDRLQPTKPAWQLADGSLFNPDISADGSTVVWTQYGTAGSGGQQIWSLKWQQAGATPKVVSLGDDGQQASKLCDYATVSGNGRYVAFQSMDMTLDAQAVAGQSGGNRTKAYVRDTLLGNTEMVSVVGVNTIPNGSGMKPDITPDGRYVAFYSDATALQGVTSSEEDGEETTTTYQQVYRRDRVAKTTIPVSVATATMNVFGDGASAIGAGPSISDDGNRVAFDSMATNLVDGDTNADNDAFVRDITAGTTTRVSVDSNGAQVDTDDTDDVAAGEIEDDPATNEDESGAVDALPVGSAPVISGDGTTVAYASLGVMAPDDANGVSDVYTMRLAGGMGRGSMVDDPADTNAFEASGTRTDGHTGETVAASNGADPAITRTGNVVAFTSQGNLTGIAASEEGEDTGEETEPATSIEPNIYVRRPNPDADLAASDQAPVVKDTTAPSSRAYSPTRTSKKSIKVRYTVSDRGTPTSGVKSVRLLVKKPGWKAFKWVQTDTGAGINGIFRVKATTRGVYKFMTVAIDKAGNKEHRPAVADDKTRRR